MPRAHFSCQSYERKLKHFKKHALAYKPTLVIPGEGDDEYTFDFKEMTHKDFKNMPSRLNEDGTSKSFVVYTVNRHVFQREQNINIS